VIFAVSSEHPEASAKIAEDAKKTFYTGMDNSIRYKTKVLAKEHNSQAVAEMLFDYGTYLEVRTEAFDYLPESKPTSRTFGPLASR